jgi:UDP-GlcNAc:undecaprenyl-phosphate/decaprenyl-phosphate GlcNAc-1-phosphate transferase
MRFGWPALAFAAGAAVAAALATPMVAAAPRRLVRTSHAGKPVPAVLGLAMMLAITLAVAVIGLVQSGALRLDLAASVTIPALAAALVAAVGALDDLLGTEEHRGFRGHLGGLLRGRVTTGVLKLAVGVAAGVLLAIAMGGSPVRVVAAAVLIAGSVNLWNALDVVPGRALKWVGVVLLPVLVATAGEPYGVVAAAVLGGVAGVLPFDLAERGMLGDAGSNPLGLLVGLGLALALPTWGVAVAAVAVLALQVAAETVTISRAIEAVPPLRWFDRLGRRR